MNWIKLHTHKGTPIYINADSIEYIVFTPEPPNARTTKVKTTSDTLTVKELPGDIFSKLEHSKISRLKEILYDD